MADWVRVKDAVTGHEYSVLSDRVRYGQTVLRGKAAVDREGKPLPGKTKIVATTVEAAEKKGDVK